MVFQKKYIPLHKNYKKKYAMNKKFMIFCDDEMVPYIILAVVDFHKEIDALWTMDNPTVRCGGGWWQVTKDGVLRLYDSSEDFGKYNEEMAREAFENKNVYYFDEPAFDIFRLKSLVLD